MCSDNCSNPIDYVKTGQAIHALRVRNLCNERDMVSVLELNNPDELYAMEAGNQLPTLDQVVLLCNHFGVLPSDIVRLKM